MFELAKNYGTGQVQIKTIADNQNIPQNYLLQLLIHLKRQELVESIRGAKGGYKLMKPPAQVKLIDVIEALESPLKAIDYSGTSQVLSNFWSEINDNIKDLFNVTLEKLVNDDDILQKRINYQI